MELAAPTSSGLHAARRPPAACTVIARNYLSHATVLAESYLRHERGGRFYVLVVDGLPDGTRVEPGLHVLVPADLELPDFYEMSFKYTVVELATAVKPSLFRFLLERRGEEELVYLDPDILITKPLDELREAWASGSVVLTPHILRPIPADGRKPSEQDILTHGAYNLGFLGLRNTAQTQELLRWWEERLRDGCRADVTQGLFVDQRWADLIPGLFPSTVLLRDDTYNVAFWNLHERALEKRGEQFLVNGRPLTFFHFSGFDPQKRRVLSRHQNRTEVLDGTALAELLDWYADAHARHGYQVSGKWQYGYARFDNGVRVNPVLRRLYLSLDKEARARFGDPFRAGGKDSFLQWATEPPPGGSDLSLFLEGLHQARADLSAAFPDVGGKGRDAFVSWARAQGAREMGYEPELVRASEVVTTAANGRAAAPAGGERVVPPFVRYCRLVRRIRETVRAVLPDNATLIVASKGDNDLLRFDGRTAWHFPQTEDGGYAGHYPADGAAAVAHLEALRARGGQFLLLPGTALWWLEHYQDFRQHLECHYRVVLCQEDTCLIFAPREPGTGGSDPALESARAGAFARP